ncbi:MAG: hypothetical protein QOD76_1273 [Solirubrobacteraceae bacterium]|nr:hypothetical protein [Solirubrobacteraceae bacterium]
MLVAPLVLLGASVVAPSMSSTKEGPILQAIAAHPDRFFISTVMLIVGVILLVPAVLGLMHMLRERRVAIGHIGGGLTMIGVLTFMLFGGVSLVEWQMIRGGADRGQMVSLLHRFDHTAGTQVFMYLSLAFTIGLIVLAAGLWAAREVAWSVSAALAIGAVVLQVAIISNTSWLFIVAAAILFAGFATIGWMTLMESDEAWEHPPQVTGLRPMLGAH